MAYLVDRSWTEGSRKRIWEADDDLKKWTKRKLEAEENARVQAEISREERTLKKAMLEVEWKLGRAQVWLDDMEISYKVTDDKSTCLEDEDEEMEDMNKLCVRLVVEEMEQ